MIATLITIPDDIATQYASSAQDFVTSTSSDLWTIIFTAIAGLIAIGVLIRYIMR